MRSTRDEYDLRIGFSFIDSGYLKEVGVGEFTVYLVLRRFVWRSPRGPLGAWWGQGLLASKVTQQEIAKMLGVGLATVERKIARLKKLGWVKAQKLEGQAGRAAVYVLGRKVEDPESGLKGEVFWADALFENWVQEKEGPEEPPGEPLILRGSTPQKDGLKPSKRGDEPLEKRDSSPPAQDVNPPQETPSDAAPSSPLDKGKNQNEGSNDRGDAPTLARSSVEKLIGREARDGAHACTEGQGAGSNGRFKTQAGVKFFRESFLCKWKLGLLPKVGRREQKHVKDLIEQWGEGDFKRVVEYLMEHFPRLRKRFNWTDAFPSIRLLYAFRDPLRGCLEASPLAQPNDRWTQETAEKSPDVGWS